MTTYMTASYWPLFRTTEYRQFRYASLDGSLKPFTSVFCYDRQTDSMKYMDFDENLNWKDTWFYQYRNGFGIAEWRDDYPNKSIEFWTPIGWGDMFEVGQAYSNSPVVNPFKSWPPIFGGCFQAVGFEAVLPKWVDAYGVEYENVLVFTYLQRWGDKQCTGARYWMAAGVGPVAVQWLGVMPEEIKYLPDMSKVHLITTSRCDAVVTRLL